MMLCKSVFLLGFCCVCSGAHASLTAHSGPNSCPGLTWGLFGQRNTCARETSFLRIALHSDELGPYVEFALVRV